MRFIMFIGILLSLVSSTAWAYIDPGTGSILLQIVFALFASSYLWFKKVTNFVRNLFRKQK